MKPGKDFALEVYFSKWEFTARYNIGGSDIESLTLSALMEYADDEDRQQWENLYLGYTETYGSPGLREVIGNTYQDIAAEDILCFAGAEEAIYCAMHAILGQEDHALVCYPNYQSAESIPLSICETDGINLDPNNDWALDLEELYASLRPNTKLIYINFPHNPTGKILERSKYDALIDLCRQRGIYLFSDEVYRLIERDPQTRLPQVADVYEQGLSLNVMSKAYGMAGLRIGWIACKDRKLLRSMERIKHYLSICNSAPSEMLAIIALKARDKILERNRMLVAGNLKLLNQFFEQQESLFDWYIPDGGCIGFPRYRGAEGVEEFTNRLVEEAGLILPPASVYKSDLGKVPVDRFRIGFGRAYLPEALEVFRDYLSRRGK
jgi:aspartate/methionine/tyrosine aminotransferase